MIINKKEILATKFTWAIILSLVVLGLLLLIGIKKSNAYTIYEQSSGRTSSTLLFRYFNVGNDVTTSTLFSFSPTTAGYVYTAKIRGEGFSGGACTPTNGLLKIYNSSQQLIHTTASSTLTTGTSTFNFVLNNLFLYAGTPYYASFERTDNSFNGCNFYIYSNSDQTNVPPPRPDLETSDPIFLLETEASSTPPEQTGSIEMEYPKGTTNVIPDFYSWVVNLDNLTIGASYIIEIDYWNGTSTWSTDNTTDPEYHFKDYIRFRADKTTSDYWQIPKSENLAWKPAYNEGWWRVNSTLWKDLGYATTSNYFMNADWTTRFYVSSTAPAPTNTAGILAGYKQTPAGLAESKIAPIDMPNIGHHPNYKG